MPSRSRFAASVAYKILEISVLLPLLFVAGCKTSEPSSAVFFIPSTSLPTGAVSVGGGTYSATLQASGGIAPYTWILASVPNTTNVLPPGLTLSLSGTITGMPTAAGTYSFTVQVADSGVFQLRLLKV